MTDPVAERIRSPKYLELQRERNGLGWPLTALMLLVYYGCIALIAFDKAFRAQPIGKSITTLGVPLGFGAIVFTITIIGIYVRRATGRYDTLTQAILNGCRPMKKQRTSCGFTPAQAALACTDLACLGTAAHAASGDVGAAAKQTTN